MKAPGGRMGRRPPTGWTAVFNQLCMLRPLLLGVADAFQELTKWLTSTVNIARSDEFDEWANKAPIPLPDELVFSF